ncbi:17992_t:CDS:2 [Funneliformis geosporum]|uniref:17992_t:CDS:1 n=1 Tax=Funneliformis geosporum TaxID=1117311 RepID=A0A9W4SMB4_9GLOM|nr:17992_t:CDS:2 [Funneliformis geosporum]
MRKLHHSSSSVVYADPSKMENNEKLAKRQMSCEKTRFGDWICTEGQPSCTGGGCIG